VHECDFAKINLRLILEWKNNHQLFNLQNDTTALLVYIR